MDSKYVILGTVVVIISVMVCIYWIMTKEPIQEETYKTTSDTEMHAAVLIKSDSCPYCQKQMKVLQEYGPKAFQRIKVLDSKNDVSEIQRVVGDYSGVPFWYNPITGQKASGLKTADQLIKMGILFEK